MNARVIFDDASAMNALENMKLLRELKTVNADIGSLGDDGALAAMKRLKLAARAKQIRIELGGKVLDPSSGMGVFARTKPESVAIEQIELDSVSGEINGLLNDSATVSTRVALAASW